MILTKQKYKAFTRFPITPPQKKKKEKKKKAELLPELINGHFLRSSFKQRSINERKSTNGNGPGLPKPTYYYNSFYDKQINGQDKEMFLLNVRLINCFQKRTHIIFRFWEVHHDNEKYKLSCRSMLRVGIQCTKNNRGKEIQSFHPHESLQNMLNLLHFASQ